MSRAISIALFSIWQNFNRPVAKMLRCWARFFIFVDVQILSDHWLDLLLPKKVHIFDL